MTMQSPVEYFWTATGPSRRRPSSLPSCSSHAATYCDSARSIGFLYLQLGGTPSGSSDPPMPMHPPSVTKQPGDLDDSGRIYLVIVAKGFNPDVGLGQRARICIGRHFNDFWTSWQKVPELDRDRMFDEFKWDDENTFLIKKNFMQRCRGRFKYLLDYAQQNMVKSTCMPEPAWNRYLIYWNRDEVKLLSEKGKKVRHHPRVAPYILRELEEKEQGKKIPDDVIYIETHVKKKKNPTDEVV
ncbi:hypothetical protein FXO38_22530 [Capsicum annuum]|nr:hypothetical protein FXO38_22530 [Capsicum annuum]KAF3659206.1 hypothetical protein FXO37_14049 [Capsicum annuum]